MKTRAQTQHMKTREQKHKNTLVNAYARKHARKRIHMKTREQKHENTLANAYARKHAIKSIHTHENRRMETHAQTYTYA